MLICRMGLQGSAFEWGGGVNSNPKLFTRPKIDVYEDDLERTTFLSTRAPGPKGTTGRTEGVPAPRVHAGIDRKNRELQDGKSASRKGGQRKIKES